MKQILIVEPDEQFAVRLFQALLSVGDYQISSAPTVRQACLMVGRERQDLAFVPLDDLEGTVEALRRLQPDLPLVATVPRAGMTVPSRYADRIQGILSWPSLSLGLSSFLDEVWEQAVPAAQEVQADQYPSLPVGSGEAKRGGAGLAPRLHGMTLPDSVLTVLVSQGERLLAHAGTFSVEQAQMVAQRVAESWIPGLTAQIQFVLLPSRTSDLQLYTCPVGAGLLLTLVARPETRMEALRTQAERLAEQVMEAGEREKEPAGEIASSQPAVTVKLHRPRPEAAIQKAYAIVWGSREPLPEPLRIALGRGLERIAAENGWTLSYLEVEEKLVHVVVNCQPAQSSAWIAHRFKREAEAAIQTQFGVEKQLWEKGYYAEERGDPLSTAELDLILGRSQTA